MNDKTSTISLDPIKKMDIGNLKKLLAVMEAELQAREIVISILKAERVKTLLNPYFMKCKILEEIPQDSSTDTIVQHKLKRKQNATTSAGDNSQSDQPQSELEIVLNDNDAESRGSDPYMALYRDACEAFDPNFDSDDTKLAFTLQYKSLCDLIQKQRNVRKYLENQISTLNTSFKRCFAELEAERLKNIDKTTKLVDDITRERKKLREEIDSVRTQFEKEKEREKEMVMCLIDERNQLIVELIEEKEKNTELMQALSQEKTRAEETAEGLFEESKRSLQLELDLEQMSSKFDKHKLESKKKFQSYECEITKLKSENDKLQQELEALRNAKIISVGDGVRSSVVTINSIEHKIVPPVTSMASISITKVGYAQPVNRSTSSTYSNVQPKNHASNSLTYAADTNTTAIVSSNTSTTLTNSTITNQSHSVSVKAKNPTGMGVNISSDVNPPLGPFNNNSTNTGGSSTTGTACVAPKKMPIRGAPPPVPPNKPVLAPSALKEKVRGAQAKVKLKSGSVTTPGSGEILGRILS